MYLEGLAEQFPALKQGQCKHILSKEMFYDVPRTVVPDYGARIYWCQHTQLPLGPDNKGCGMDTCQPGRACFEKI
jgi:hypothetical protein